MAPTACRAWPPSPGLSLDILHQTARPANLSHGRVPEVLKAIARLKRMRPTFPILANIASPATLLSFLLPPSELLRLATKGGRGWSNWSPT